MKTITLLLLALCVLAALYAVPAAAELVDGLVAYWNFDGSGEDAYQATFGGQSFNATHPNGATPGAPGRFGSSIRFTRALEQYLEVDSPVITSGQDHTYSAWYRATFSDIDDGNYDLRYFIMESTGIGGNDAYAVSYGLRDIEGDGYDDRGQVYTQWPGGITAGDFDQPDLSQWHNIIVTYDASAAEHRAYLDGAPVLTMASHDPLSNVAGLIIGGHRYRTGRNWDGWIDDVSFWERVLTPSEIAGLQTRPTLCPFEDIEAGLTGVYGSSVAWGDYDNDGDLDILLTGRDSGSNPVAKMYENTGGTFSEVPATGLTGVWGSSVAWGDYDNDGDLDILLTGRDSGSNWVAKVYENTDGAFSEVPAGLTGVAGSSVAWGDYDNDGDLDILLTGYASGGPVAKVYENTGGAFSEVPAGLTGVYFSSVAWGDYDNDGDLDILLTGEDSGDNPVAKVYENTGGAFSEVPAGLTGVVASSVAWGDYDNDGDLDILLTGEAFGYNYVAKVYENTDGAFTEVPAGLTGVYASSVAWGDYDNDGDLDILLTGLPPSGGNPVAKVYENTDGAFSEVPATGLTGVYDSSVAWGDYDNDGDLDILLTAGYDSGGNPVAKVYENLTPIPNTPPTAPGNLAAVWSASGVTLSWDAATDAETPAAGLTYNLRVGTTPGGSEITAAMADDASGYRRVPALGNANHNLSWTLDVPAPPVYWSVQALDAGYAGSAFATEETAGPFSEVPATGLTGVWSSSVAWGDYDNDGDLDILLTGLDSEYQPVAKVYENTGGAFSEVPAAGLTGVYDSSVAWGDYDNDGDLDILLTGNTASSPPYIPVTKVYENTGGAFTEVPAGLTGVSSSSVAWGDYDNDGDLDILLTGLPSGGLVAKVYENTGGAFTEIPAGLTGVAYSSVAWGDYDNDGDLDILLTGYASGGPVAKVYENTGGAFTEVPPDSPESLAPRSPGGTTTTTATSTSCSPEGILESTR